LREAGGLEKTGTLSGDEITPYIRLFLEANCSEEGHNYSGPDQEYLMHLLDSIGVENLHSMIECTEIYDVPVLFSLVRNLTTEQAVLALKKVPPSYEKKRKQLRWPQIMPKAFLIMAESVLITGLTCYGSNYAPASRPAPSGQEEKGDHAHFFTRGEPRGFLRHWRYEEHRFVGANREGWINFLFFCNFWPFIIYLVHSRRIIFFNLKII